MNEKEQSTTEVHSSASSFSARLPKEPIFNVKSTIVEVGHDVIGLELYEKAQQIAEEEEKEIFKKIRRKVDWRIVPLLCITYTMQFLDKLSLNYASAYSLKEDLGLVGQRYAWVAAIFNFGYLFWAMPGNFIIQRVPVGKYVGFLLFTWAILLVAHVGLKNYAGALVIRFLLGCFEASISPACMIINGLFYKIEDQPIRMCIFLSFNGVATMLGALLGFALGHATESSIKPWKLIFMVIGLLNFAWSIVFIWLCPDSPDKAKFLTEEEKAILIKEVASNNMGIKDKSFKKYQAIEALSDIGVWMLALIGLGCGVINGGTSNFQSAIIKGFGFTGIQATALQLPAGAIELVVVITGGAIAFFVKNTRCYVLFCFCIPPLGGIVGLHLIPLENKWGLVGCTFVQFIVGGPVIMSWVLLNANVSGATKKTVSSGLWFMLYASGNIIGANIFYAYQAPRYYSGVIGLLSSYSGIMAIIIAYRFLLSWRNKNKEKIQGEMTDEMKQRAIIDGFKGLTDFENPGFRYSL